MFGSNNKPASTGFSFGNNAGSNMGANTGGGFGLGNANNNTNKPGFSLNGNNGNTSGGFGFGNNTAANSANKGLGFGGSNANTNTGGFGANNTTNTGFGANNQSGGMFGNNNNQSGGLFGNNSNNNQSGGMFGSNTANNNANNSTGGMFGNNNTNTGGGLFGNKPNAQTTTTTGMFGNNASTGNSMFGNKPANSGGLFGNNQSTFGNNQSTFGNNQSTFGNKPSGATGGLFGSNTASSGFGFGNNQSQNQNQVLGQAAQPIQLTAMTKVSDLPENFRKELEQMDEYIQTQVAISEYLKNNEVRHKDLIESIPRDIDYLEKKYVSTNQALDSDLRFIENFKDKVLESFSDWVEKLIAVYLQLTNPMSGSSNDQAQASSSGKVLIGVNGMRSDTQQQQQPPPAQPQSKDKSSPLNVAEILGSYYVTKIEDFKQNISKYQLILNEVEESINDLDKSSLNGRQRSLDANYGLELVVSTLQEEFKLYVELANDFAETHHQINRIAGKF